MPESDLPLVTIVTPSYNQAPYIRETIESVLAQDYGAIEYLVIDGGSTDQTVDILREYDGRLVWSSEPDRGPAHAINKGWARGRGEILEWLNSDDVLLPGAVAAVVTEMQRHPEAVGVYGWGLVLDREGDVAAEWLVPPVNSSDVLRRNLPFLQPATFIRADAFARIGPLDDRLNWAFDWDLFIRLLNHGPMTRIDQPLAAWRRHDECRTHTGGLPRVWEIFRLLRRYRVPFSAPAYRLHALYGCATACERASRTGPRPCRRTARRLHRGFERLIHTLVTDGRFNDGWAGRRVRWEAQGPGSALHISGALNAQAYPPLRGQILTVSIDGTRIRREALPDGDFDLFIPLPEVRSAHPVVELRASRTFVPRRIGLNDDRRHLAYMLHSIELR